MIDDNKKNYKKMLKRNGVYIALGISVLAAGIAGFSAADNKTPSLAEKQITNPVESVSIAEKTNDYPAEQYEIKINIDEFTTDKSAEPGTAAVFDNNAKSIDEVQQSQAEEATTEKEEKFFTPPLSGAIGMDFSMGIPVFSETLQDYRTHNGVDFKGVKGDSVKTVSEGTVTSVRKNPVWGNTVTIDHGDGIVSSISGLADEALISVGAKVYDSTIIGIVGEIPAEKEEDSHVHLEMRVNGKLTDPMEILGLYEEE